jgi:hypothetical protein
MEECNLTPIKTAVTIAVLIQFAVVQAQDIAYDQGLWKSIKEVKTSIPGCASPVTILLLKSQKTTGYSGAGEPMNDVELLVQAGGKVVYSYTKAKASANDLDLFMDGDLDVRGVTGDDVPEILFHSGTRGASDWHTIEHILRYDRPRATFVDITTEPLYHSGRHDLRWLTAGKQTFAIVADENWSPSVSIDYRCHYCPSPFRYDAYVWSSQRQTFVVSRHIFGRAPYETADEALAGDWRLIQSVVDR